MANDVESVYDIQKTAEEIIKRDYQRIALQFPDELLHDSKAVYVSLKNAIGKAREVYVLADTSYGSCCVDEVASSHVSADVIVHYGHACMSGVVGRVPVIYVLEKKSCDVDDCVAKFLELGAKGKGRLLYDVAYAWCTDVLHEKMKAAGLDVSYSPTPLFIYPDSVRATDSDSDVKTIWYLGGESIRLTNVLITNPYADVYTYDPETHIARKEQGGSNKLLMRRYGLMQRAKDNVKTFGIVVGTLGVASYLPLLTHLRNLISSHHRKSYTISVGKLTPSKLSNFAEIECWVLIACSESSILDNDRDFEKPIITPYELCLALGVGTWGQGPGYTFDLTSILALPLPPPPSPDSDEEDGESNALSILLRNGGGAVQYMNERRSYKGLEQRVGEDGPSVIEQGRSGIARDYSEF